MVAMNLIPSVVRTPLVAAEFDSSAAQQGPAALAYRGLLIGQKFSTGSAVANKLYLVTNADQVIALAGRGSQLHRQARAWFKANKSTEVWIGVLEDNAGGVAAAGSVAFTGTATKAGAIYLYVSGERVTVPVAIGDTATAIAAALATAIGNTSGANDLAVKATAATGTLTLTAHHKGLEGNEIDIRLNHADGESLPMGVTAVITKMTGGTLNPVLTLLLAELGDRWFHIWAHGYTDATSLTAIEAELASRVGPMRMIDAKAIAAKNDSYANCITLAQGRNSGHSVILRTNDSPHSPLEYAAAVAGVVAFYGAIDPARPMQTLPLPGILAPREEDLDTREERDILLQNGVATTKVVGGVVQIERLVTTYRLNAAGVADNAYGDLQTGLVLMYARFQFRVRMGKYNRHKLARSGARLPAGEPIMTPDLGRAEAVNWFLDMATSSPVVFDIAGLDQFKRDLVVEINATDSNRLDFLLPPDLIGQLIVTAARIQFRL